MKHQKTFGKEESICVLKRITGTAAVSVTEGQQTQKTQTASHTDRLQISSQGKDFQTAKAAVAAAPDIREELTAPIKARIQNGTYGVDNASFAEKLLQKQEEMR